tara:strand:- start:25380 stop:26756 length:1377 start_codon:yes stop_codon:yes gene_type:complete
LSDSFFSGFELDLRLKQAIEKAGFDEPSPVQQQAIPVALTGRDLLVSAETGSGKTAAFLLPLMHKLLQKTVEQERAEPSSTRALVLVPTRELAIQIVKQCDLLASCSHLKTGLIIGGNSFKYQQAIFRKNPEIIIATPGRMAEHISHASCDLTDIEVLVLDEADRMLDLGLAEDVIRIANNCNGSRQTFLFSATLTHKAFAAIEQDILDNPEIIKLNAGRQQNGNIKQQVILADGDEHKDNLLSALFERQEFTKALVFCNTRAQVNRLCGLIRYRSSAEKPQRAGLLHGDMSQEERRDTVSKLRGGSLNIIFATDLAARGLDIKGVDLIINYDVPRSGTDYTHRIGRTGRAGEEGLAVALVSSNDWNLMSSIERFLKVRLERRKLAGLEARYKGPKKLKSSGKAAGSKKKKNKNNAAKMGINSKKTKPKKSGKSESRESSEGDRSKQGFSPLKKKTKN